MRLADAESLAVALMKEHKLRGWRFRFDNAKRRFGRCWRFEQEITLSRHLVEVNDEARVRNTILHEIAHALAPAGSKHNGEWKRIAERIGCDARRLHNAVMPPALYTLTCPVCGGTESAHRKGRGDRACYVCTRGLRRTRSYEPFRMVWTKNR